VSPLDAAGKTAIGEANIRLAYADALAATGDEDAARSAIATAKERVLARSKTLADPDLRRAFLEDVVEHADTLRRT
jgi:hypothetical protein